MEFDVKSILSLAGLLFAVSNGVLGFMWKNLKDDISKLEKSLTCKANKTEIDQLGKIVEKIEENLTLKADKTELDQRRNDIKQLFEDMHKLERAFTEKLNEAKTDILVELAKLGGQKNANTTRRSR